MPKKTRKAKIRASQRAVSPAYAPPARPVAPRPMTDEEEVEDRVIEAPVARSAVMPARTARTSRVASAASRTATPIVVDYSYVFKDLRRIALLAGFFLMVMVLLYFLIEIQHIPIIPGVM